MSGSRSHAAGDKARPNIVNIHIVKDVQMFSRETFLDPTTLEIPVRNSNRDWVIQALKIMAEQLYGLALARSSLSKISYSFHKGPFSEIRTLDAGDDGIAILLLMFHSRMQ